MKRLYSVLCRSAALAVSVTLAVSFTMTVPGCAKPALYGPGRFHDISRVKMGMSESEVRNIMGAGYKSIWEEGLGGMDMGIYIWQYSEGRIHFSPNGVIKIQPY